MRFETQNTHSEIPTSCTKNTMTNLPRNNRTSETRLWRWRFFSLDPMGPGDNAAGAWTRHAGRFGVVDLGQDGVDGGGGEPAGAPRTGRDHSSQRITIKNLEMVV